jgi:hypothetical protein|tara:strand:+ start:211 stop:732 length:522 start_codon:yes stop_codon:yes gene_type:complete
MSKDMKLIMEGWRKYSTPKKTEQEVLEEGMKGLLGALMMGFGLSYAPNAMGAGFENADDATMEVVADALELVSQKDASLKGAAKLAKDIAENPAEKLTFGDMEASQMANAYLVDQFASQVDSPEDLKALKLKVDKLQGKVSADKAEKEDDASSKTMQQRMRDANKGTLDFVKE